MLDGTGNVLARESFGPFGARRGSNWQGVPSTADYTTFSSTTRQGFTGQEMLDSVGLVHMNGRVYDPTLGRFLSADTVIQTLGSSQAINQYAYAWNDPLKYIDPSGHSLLGDIVGLIVGIIVAIYLPELAPEYFESMSASTLAVAGFVGGFVGAYVSTGSLSAALTAGLIAGLTAAAFTEIGTYASQLAHEGSEWAKPFSVLAHAAVGCVGGVASGGNCGRGALAAGISEAAVQGGMIKPAALGTWGSFKGAAEAGLVGGAAARITGGKFDDGFTVSAAGYLFNSAAHSRQSASEADQEIFDASGQSLPLSPYSLEILPFATLDVGTYSVYSYQLVNVLGEPLTGSGYSLREQVEPAIGMTSNADFVSMDNGVATDLVGWVPPVLAPQNFLLVTTQTFPVQVHGEIYPLTSQFQHVNQVVGGVVSNTVTVIRQ